jgi:two-component system response regulator
MTPPVVLLVEDNATDEELALRVLRKAKIPAQIVVARDGAAALDYLFCAGAFAGRDPDLPKVVLLDLNLPKLSGLEVLRRIRADPRTSLVRVVILTSSGEDKDIKGCYRAGADSYVVKPVDSSEFFEAVKLIALYWLGLNVAESPTAQVTPLGGNIV